MIALITNALAAFIKIATWLEALVNFFITRQAEIDKRLKAAEDAEEAAKQRAKESQFQKERANIAAFKLASSETLKSKHKKMVEFLSSNKPEEVLILIQDDDLPFANSIIFEKDYSIEYKALQLIKLMTPA